ncbi:cytochrome oxidase putative small subunit CydP [Polaromonas naphthalenivorans]|uniref:cytochrome oxidase putative small subunit CydP n=1 Tax=Polaromonas naphthalenivorans TaxID=216465 RepID=UPI0003147973|nr:cytochrome oxidase putative small subunit CydP [Polaromonas naphthalenivorans]
MPTLKNPLVKKLAVVLLIKLVVLVALWWGFVRDQRVTVNTNTVAAQLAGWLRFGA